jgi:hypothetical protein
MLWKINESENQPARCQYSSTTSLECILLTAHAQSVSATIIAITEGNWENNLYQLMLDFILQRNTVLAYD